MSWKRGRLFEGGVYKIIGEKGGTFIRGRRFLKVGRLFEAIRYVDFLQFQRYFIPQAELEIAFTYIIHKPIEFSIDVSYRLKTILGHMVIGLKQVRVPIGT